MIQKDIIRANQQYYGGQDTEWNFFTQRISGNNNRSEECRTAYNHQCIEDIAAYNISDGDVRAAFQSRRDADRQFGSGSPESYDGEADNNGRDAEALGDGCGSVCESVGS